MNKVATTPQFPRPAFVLDAKVEFEALAAEHPDLAFVDAVVVDLCGALRGKRLPVGEARKIFESGIQLRGSIDGTLASRPEPEPSGMSASPSPRAVR